VNRCSKLICVKKKNYRSAGFESTYLLLLLLLVNVVVLRDLQVNII